MKSTVIKIVSVILAIALSSVLSSCAAVKMTDEEAVNILNDLVPKSQELNKIYWGEAPKLKNADAKPVSNVDAGQYCRVSEDFPYQSVEELKAASEKVFSESYLKDIYATAFSSQEYSDEKNTYKIHARYVNDKNGHLCYDITNKNFLKLTTVIDISSAKVEKIRRKKVDVKVDIEIDSADGKKKSSMIITLVSQNGEWRLDSPTY